MYFIELTFHLTENERPVGNWWRTICRTFRSGVSCEAGAWAPNVSFSCAWTNFAEQQKSLRTRHTCTPCLLCPRGLPRAPLVPIPYRTVDHSRQSCSKTCWWCISSALLPSRSDWRVCVAKGGLGKTITWKMALTTTTKFTSVYQLESELVCSYH